MKPLNKEVDFTFYPTKDFKECPVCGICSFPHIHRKGTLPKDFERIEPENKCKHEFTVKGKNCLKCGMPILNMTDYEKWEREEEDYEWDIKPENKSTKEEWEKELDKITESARWAFRAYGNQNGFKDQNAYSEKEVNAIKDFIRQKISQAEEKGYQRGYKEGVDDTLDEYGDGPSS